MFKISPLIILILKAILNLILTDDEFRENVEVARKHCQRGDVFQLGII